MHSLPIFLRLEDRAVILLGDGSSADAKRRLLTRAGARIVGEDEQAALAIVAIEDEEETRAAVDRLRARGILVNAVDRPELCDFTLPAIVDRDPVLIAIGTGGASAGLAKALRQRIEALLPSTLGRLADALQAARPAIRACFSEPAQRRRAIDAALDPGGPLDPLTNLDSDAVSHWIEGETPENLSRVIDIQLRSPDPDQLTLAEARWLAQADTIIHEVDVPAAILDRARADAIRLPVMPETPPRRANYTYLQCNYSVAEAYIDAGRVSRDGVSMQTQAYINRIGTALPPHEAHAAFLAWAQGRITDRRDGALFKRMASRSGIEQRWTVLPPTATGDQTGLGGFYENGGMPPTSARMAVYAQAAPDLCVAAVEALGSPEGITHIVLASCTGFIAPGIDQIVAKRLGLPSSVERTLIGFMGCYAAVSALRTAHHIVRSQPEARVLVITVELCTLHLQPDTALGADPRHCCCSATARRPALVTAEPTGLAMSDPFATTLPDSEELIGWTIGDMGFAMHLSGAVPARIGEALADASFRARLGDIAAIDGWAVHAGGGVPCSMRWSRASRSRPRRSPPRARVLRDCGNMSSSTLMFVFDKILRDDKPIDNGLAIAFGPGLAAEGFRFRRAA